MDYYKYQVKNAPNTTEALIALFSISPFDTFLESESGFEAFIPAHLDNASIEEHLQGLQTRFAFSYQKEFIKGENWNVVWESNFHPVLVDSFCGIRADFHPSFEQVEHELVINPKMAFGTGHHETTFSVIELMRELKFANQTVLDFGCGTGILSILAARLGAQSIVAVDIEKESYLNTIENCEKNKVQGVQAIHGVLEDVPADTYGIVLANINRNVILNSLQALAGLVAKGGFLVISGFVLSDKILMEKAIAQAGFEFNDIKEKGNWLAMKCQKT